MGNPSEHTHETISDRFIITDYALCTGGGWTRLFGSIDVQEPALIPAFAITCTQLIRQCSGIRCNQKGDGGETHQPGSICTSCSCRTGSVSPPARGETCSSFRQNTLEGSRSTCKCLSASKL